MKTVREILINKGTTIWSVSPETTVFEGLKLMADKGIGALLVLNENNAPVGIMSERDYARKVILLGKTSHETKIKEIMTSKVIYVKPDRTPEECMALMITKKIRHLPVIEKNELIGLISIGDVVNAIIDEKEFTIDQLVNYITSTPQLSAVR